tara:strand:+ start:300 stop:683 length:384 start_codon:yes stop_codon:yes gene_type:complete
MTDEEKPDVQPIQFGGKTYDLNLLSQEQKNQIGLSQQIGSAIGFLGDLNNLIKNLGNLSSLAAIGLEKANADTAKAFPAPIELPTENGATLSETPAPATLTADDAKETAEQSDSGEVVPPGPEGKTH